MAYATAQARRRPNETVHDFQHRLIAERKARHGDAPKRSGLDKLRRREMAKDAWWTLTGHLRGQHAVKTNFLGKTWDEVEAHHDRIHAEHGQITQVCSDGEHARCAGIVGGYTWPCQCLCHQDQP